MRRRSSGHEESLDSTAAAASAAGLDTDTFFIDGTRIQGVVPLHTPASAAGAASSSVLLAGHFTESTLSSGKLRVEVVLKLARDDDPSSLELLRSEAQVLESLKGGTGSGCIDLYHAHLDATTSPNGRPYLVLERFGESITALLHPGCQLIPIAINRTVLAVAALHSHGIMHGDIKPGNILYVERHGMLDVKLCDLECARRVGEPFPHDGQSLRYTELYASPEVLRGKAGELKASLEMDLFSLGLVLWQLANKQSELPAFLQNSSERDELYAATQEQLDAKLRTVSREGGSYYLLETAFELCRLAPAERPSAVTLAGKLTMSVTSLHQQAQLGHRLDNMGQSVDSLSGKIDQLLNAVEDGFNSLHTQLESMHCGLRSVMLHARDEVTAMLDSWTDTFDQATRSPQLTSDPTAAAALLQSVAADLQKSLAGAATDAVKEQLGAALEPVLAQLQAVSLQVTSSAEAHCSSSDITGLLAYVREQMGKLHSEIADVKHELTVMHEKMEQGMASLSDALEGAACGAVVLEGQQQCEQALSALRTQLEQLKDAVGTQAAQQLDEEGLRSAVASLGPELANQVAASIVQVCGPVSEVQPDELSTKLDMLLDMVGNVEEDVAFIKELTSVIECRSNRFPHTFVIKPKPPPKKLDADAAVSLLARGRNFINRTVVDRAKKIMWYECLVTFACPVSMEEMECGPEGKSYPVRIPTSLLRNLAPALRWGVFFLRVGLATQGLGAAVPPVEQMFPAFTKEDLPPDFVEEALAMAQDSADNWAKRTQAMVSIIATVQHQCSFSCIAPSGCIYVCLREESPLDMCNCDAD